jgi:hypothetical protein
MLLTYGKKFTDQWGGADPDKLIGHWAQQLGSYTTAELKRGFAALETKDWPPSLPEFKKLCRPPIDSASAYYEAIEGLQRRERGEVGTWSHPAIFWAAASMTYDLLNMTFAAMQKRWDAALIAQMEKGQWESIPKPMVALPAPGHTKTDKQNADRMLAQYKAMDTFNKNGHRSWVEKVFERQKAGDPTLPGIAVRFAKEAMSVKDKA